MTRTETVYPVFVDYRRDGAVVQDLDSIHTTIDTAKSRVEAINTKERLFPGQVAYYEDWELWSGSVLVPAPKETEHRTTLRGHKLSHAQADEIRYRRAEGWNMKDIAQEYGISRQMVSYIVNGHAWN